ncbi:unnamed protein product [Brachionus calyciflorus]|uniref:UBC core domain-containing protein n=1 Tax=Brachionus calyciflorus TaxID=104777 RepID=A0A813MNC9_9BILA|nr:unnamed protein product [Brachionus calyciflorus]
MFSRAHLIIQNEINEVDREKDISVIKLDENNIFELIALIEGLPNTIWENGIFQIYMKFSENYNFIPPKVYFQTVPYHPNIDITTGKPSLDFLDDISKWNPNFTIKHILKSLQQLLAYPLLDRSVNMDAVFMLKGNPKQYATLAKQSVLSTQKIRNMLKDIDFLRTNELDNESLNSVINNFQLFKLEKETTEISRGESSNKNDASKKNKQFSISFEEYSSLWKGIATTKSNKNDENIYLKDDLYKKPDLISQHFSISIHELEHQINKQLSEHKNLMYGRFNFEKKAFANSNHQSATNKQQQQTKIPNYNQLNKNNIQELKPITESYVSTQLVIDRDDDLFEQEVDELIEWTNKID